MRESPAAFFLRASPGQRFCVYSRPRVEAARAAVVFVHGWADEMNKSRRMVAQQARLLAQAGHAVLQVDLHGCGDSSGDFADASWTGWIDDVVLATQWLLQRHPGPLWLWGMRAGCLLAAAAASRLPVRCNFLFWQPATSGKTLLHQFLRLRAAADMQQSGGKGIVEALRQRLHEGNHIDIAGYTLPPALGLGLEQATLVPPTQPAHIVWLEIAAREGAAVLPLSGQTIAEFRALGHHVDAQVVQGPAFWQTQEVEDAPALLPATLAALQSTLQSHG